MLRLDTAPAAYPAAGSSSNLPRFATNPDRRRRAALTLLQRIWTPAELQCRRHQLVFSAVPQGELQQHVAEDVDAS